MIPALGVNEPYASAIVHGLKRWETRGQPPNGEMRPDGVQGFPGVRLPRGGRVMVIANKKRPRHVVSDPNDDLPPWCDLYAFDRFTRWTENLDGSHTGVYEWVGPVGHIVGSVTVPDAVPIIPDTNDPSDKAIYHCIDGRLELQVVTGDPWVASNVHHTDISDQRPWGDWTPGRWAWQLAEPLTTNEMCPVCEGTGDLFVGNVNAPDSYQLCPVCKGRGRCDPIPVRGHQGLRPLTPEQFL